MTFFHFKFL